MRDKTDVIIPIPKPRNTHVKIEVNSIDVTGKVMESVWIYPATAGIGTFRILLYNALGQLTNLFNRGDTVKFYADNKDNTTLQFWGRIDYKKDNISEEGQFLEIEGRHRSFLLTEFLISHSAVSTLTSQILKDIIDKLPVAYGFTKNNITDSTDYMDVEWNYRPFWDCVIDLCSFAGFDCYVDNSLDFHYFEENSILNEDEVISEGNNFIKTNDWGVDDYSEKTRVIVMGQDENGLPIVYTAIDDEEDEIKEIFIKDSSANTELKVRNLAQSKLSELINRNPQGVIESYGLETIKPGDNISIIIPRQKIFGVYKAIQIKHMFGSKFGGWRTELLIEYTGENISKKLENLTEKNSRSSLVDNVNKLNFTWNDNFEEDSGTHSSTEITGGVLKTDGGASGTWISDLRTLSSNATKCEIRVRGQSIPGTLFYLSVDDGVTYQSLTLNTLKNLSPPGNNLKIKIELNSASTQIYSMVLLYS